MAEQFANDIQTTLSGNIDASVTSISVASAAGFPSSAQYRIRIDDELMLVTAGAGTTSWVVTRHVEGTAAAIHLDAADVVHVLTAGALGTSSDPAAGTPGLRSLGTGAQQAAAGSALANKEDVANKSTDATFGANSDTLYPSQKAVKDALASAVSSGIPATLFDVKGDLLAASADNTAAKVAVGTNGQVLTAASGAPAGVQWATISGGTTSIFERTLTLNASAGASTITIDAASAFAANSGLIAIDPFTVECEIRRVASGTTTLTLSNNLTFAHSSGDRVLFFADNFAVPITWWGWTHGANASPFVQAALDAIRPDGVGRALHFPAESYRFDSTVTVGSDTQIIGDGAGGGGSYGTQFRNSTDAKVFDLRTTSSPVSVKDATRVTFEGIQFVKHTDFATSAYVIDADASDFVQINDCTFGNYVYGSMNGISLAGAGVNWIERCRFVDIGAAGQPVQTSGDDAAIKATGGDVLNVTNCTFERSSKILLTDLKASYFRGCHMEVSALVLHNSSHNTFEDFTPTSTDVMLDNKSNDNVFDNVSGVASRLIDLGSNTYRKVTGFTNVGRLTRGFGPFDGENSPITPDVIATDWTSDPAVAYGQPGDVLLFAIKAMSPVNASAIGPLPILVKDTSGATLDTSPSITLGYLGSVAPGPRTTSRNMESYTYWSMVTVPAGQKVYIDSPFVCSVWASKVVNPDPFLNATTFWGGGAQSGSFSAAATCTPTMSATQYRVDWTSGAAWSVTQYMKWPALYSGRYLQVLRGRWDDTTQHMSLGDTNLEAASDLASIRSRWSTGDGAANLQTTDKMLFSVIQPGITVADGSRVSNAKYLRTSFGGFGVDFTANTQVEIDWCAVVPLDPPGPVKTAQLGSGTASSSTYLRGDQTWASPIGTGAVATDTIWDTKGDLAAATAADTAAKLPVGASVTDRLIADPAATTGLKWTPHIVRKTADETVNNSATLQNDDHLLFPVLANEIWFFQAWLITSGADITADLKYGFSVPSGTTMLWGALGGPNNNFSSWGGAPVANTPIALQTAGTSMILGSGAVTQGVSLAGTAVASSTPGNVNLQWAQNTATVSDTKVLTNSFLILWRLA